MPRKKVDLRVLPKWLQRLIALAVVAVVAGAALRVRGVQPIPEWAQTYLLPVLGVTYFALLVYVIYYRVFRK